MEKQCVGENVLKSVNCKSKKEIECAERYATNPKRTNRHTIIER